MADLPLFPFSSQEDWYGELVFTSADDGSALSLDGRTFVMLVTPAAQVLSGSLDPVATLTMAPGGGLSLKVGAGNTLIFRVPRSTALGFPRTEYTADVLEVVDGERHLFMPIRVQYSDPSGIRTFASRNVGVAVSFSARVQPIVSPVAVAGRQGAPGATIITGAVPPVPADGRDGDFWIEDRTASNRSRRMYGPKTRGAWPGTPWTIQVATFADVPGLPDALGGKLDTGGSAAGLKFDPGGGAEMQFLPGLRSALIRGTRIFVPESDDFGARGDGAADDTAAFAKLNTALRAAGAGTVVLKGAYKLPDGWIVPSNIRVEGSGRGYVKHRGSGTSYSAGILPEIGGRGVRLTGVGVEAPSGIARADAKFGIWTDSHEGLIAEDCWTRYGLSGLWLNRCTGFTSRRNRHIDPVADGQHFAIGCNSGSVTGNKVTGSGDDAFATTNDLDSAADPSLRTRSISFRDNDAENVRHGGGYMIYDGTDILIEGNRGKDIAGPLWQIAHHSDSIYNERITLRGNDGLRVAQDVNANPDILNPATVIANARTVRVEGGNISGVGGRRPVAVWLNDFFDVELGGAMFADIAGTAPSIIHVYSGNAAAELRLSDVGFARVAAPLDLSARYENVASTGRPSMAPGAPVRITYGIPRRQLNAQGGEGWPSYVPAAAGDNGSTATIAASAEYQLVGKTLHLIGRGSIAYSTGAQGFGVNFPLPPGMTISGSANGVGRENAKTGKQLSVFGYSGQSNLVLLDYVGGSIIQNGAAFAFEVTMQIS